MNGKKVFSLHIYIILINVTGYKTKNAALERKIMQLDLINKEHEKLDICLCKEEPPDTTSDELKDLNNKLNAVNKKLYDTKNRNLELKNDILLATKILQQELGDKFTSIKELQNDLAGWKGRAQQIVLLQARCSELEEKLSGKHKDLIEAKRKDQTQVIFFSYYSQYEHLLKYHSFLFPYICEVRFFRASIIFM